MGSNRLQLGSKGSNEVQWGQSVCFKWVIYGYMHVFEAHFNQSLSKLHLQQIVSRGFRGGLRGYKGVYVGLRGLRGFKGIIHEFRPDIGICMFLKPSLTKNYEKYI